jgi:hypothetical protein
MLFRFDDDELQLTEGQLIGGCLAAGGESFHLNTLGAQIATLLLSGPISFRQLTKAVSQLYPAVPMTTIRTDTQAFVESLEATGLMRLQRGRNTNWLRRLWSTVFLPLPTTFRCARRRFRPSALSMALAVAFSFRMILALGLAVSAALVCSVGASGLPLRSNAALIALPAMLTILFVVSVIAHEEAHLATARIVRLQIFGVVAGGMRCSLRHETSSESWRNRVVAIAGPTAGILTSVASQLLTRHSYLIRQPSLVVLALIGFGHAVSFLPWSDDGATIWQRSRT